MTQDYTKPELIKMGHCVSESTVKHCIYCLDRCQASRNKTKCWSYLMAPVLDLDPLNSLKSTPGGKNCCYCLAFGANIQNYLKEIYYKKY